MEMTDVELLVLETLRRSASQNVEILKSAAQRLKEWEVEPGFYSILLKIISNHSVDPTVRWLAATFFKNGVDRYWRKSAPNAIKDKEKKLLRRGLMETLREPVDQVAVQLAVLISKIARFDFPKEWPELVPTLLEMTKSQDLLTQHRGLLILYHVIKTLASKMLMGHRRIFQQLTADIYPYILSSWNSHFENFFAQEQVPQCRGTLERALLTLKILRRLTVNGFKQPCQQSADVVAFMTSIYDRIRKMLYYRKLIENESPPTMRELSEKVVINLIKVFPPILEFHPESFVTFFRPSLEFTVTYLFTAHGDGLLFEKFTVHAMNLLKAIILCSKCKISRYTQEPKGPEHAEAHRIKTEFFQANVLAEICRKLVTQYFLLTRDDLQLWDSDPEGFEERATSDDAGESWKVSLRPCAYSLFMALFHEYRESLSLVLLELIQSYHQLVSPHDMDAILRKDAVYNAVGLAAFDLYDEVDFDRWFSTTLTQELSIKEPNYRVIRRRVAWLIGQWAGIKLSPELRPALYRALIPLLGAEEDVAVRLSAALALKRAVDDFQFISEQFMEFLEPSFSLLFRLLQEVEECDSKLQVLNVLSFIVERMGSAIKPYSQNLVRYLPLLWDESVNHNMLRCAIVSTLVRFVRGLMTENLSSFLFPVIELCTDLSQSAHVYLLEEGLELWFAVLDNSTSLSPELLHLYRSMASVLDYTQEHLRCCGFIIQAYTLLDPQRFLTEYGESVMTSCLNLLADANSDGMLVIMQIIETAIRANSSLAIALAMPIFPKMLSSCTDNRVYPQRVLSMFFAIMSRILLYSRDVFSQLLANAAREASESSDAFLGKLLTLWLYTHPLVAQEEERKLLALALSSLLTVGSSAVVDEFAAIVQCIVEALNDIVDVDELATQIDSLMVSEELNSSEELESQTETENEKRRKRLVEIDPVYNIELRAYFQSQLNEFKSKIGVGAFQKLIRELDFEIVEQCRSYGML